MEENQFRMQGAAAIPYEAEAANLQRMREIETENRRLLMQLQQVKSLKQLSRGQPKNIGHSKQAIFRWLKN